MSDTIELSPKERILQWAHDNNVKAVADFMPFSRSRNAGEKHKSLNWRVTLLKGDKTILTTDYSAGIAHCPAYKASVRELGHRDCILRAEAIAYECEHGYIGGGGLAYTGIGKHRVPIEPDLCDVLYSLSSDAAVINYCGFEDWADCMGYGSDSRKAEAIYRACLDIYLQLRNALGSDALEALTKAYEDY